MARIFICYRRDDTSGYAGRLRDALSAHFGAQEIFRDIDTIGPGEDFVAAMTAAIAKSRVFLVLIGRRWLHRERAGERALESEGDYVRREITTALEQNVRVIPVLVEGVSMPTAAELPEAIRPLAARNAIALDDEGWESDVGRLVAAIRQAIDEPARVRLPRIGRGRSRALAVAVVALAVLIGYVLLRRSTPGDEPAAPSSVSTARPGSAGARAAVTLPGGGEAEVGEATVEILEASRTAQADGSLLTLDVRLTNRGRYDTLLSDGLFRLLFGDQSIAPTNHVTEVVASETSKEASLTFTLPPAASAGRLQIVQGDERGEIPLDVSGHAGVTPGQDLEARRSGRTTTQVHIDPTAGRMRFGELVCELRAAVLRRYANKLTLTLKMRAANNGRYDVDFGDGHFRVVTGEIARAPVSRISVVVPGHADREEELVFDLPLDTTQIVLRGRYGESTADVRLNWPRAPAR